jgi:hypothetical protein
VHRHAALPRRGHVNLHMSVFYSVLHSASSETNGCWSAGTGSSAAGKRDVTLLVVRKVSSCVELDASV